MQTVEYYDNMTPDEWKPVLGEKLNFHFGFYRHDYDFERGLRLATRRLLCLFGGGRRVLDVGCGWGGPALDLIRSGYDVVCVTNSLSQYEYCKSLSLAASLMDIEYENMAPLGFFDTVFMMESLDHVFDKVAFLSRLTSITDRLVLVTNCCVGAREPPLATFGGTMWMTSAEALLGMLEIAGWRIRCAADVREYSMPTFLYWKTRIESAYPADRKPAVALLHSLCEIALQDTNRFVQLFPLLTVCAEPSGNGTAAAMV